MKVKVKNILKNILKNKKVFTNCKIKNRSAKKKGPTFHPLIEVEVPCFLILIVVLHFQVDEFS